MEEEKCICCGKTPTQNRLKNDIIIDVFLGRKDGKCVVHELWLPKKDIVNDVEIILRLGKHSREVAQNYYLECLQQTVKTCKKHYRGK